MNVDFTASQQRAVDIAQGRRDTCIVAGPGSGKTTVLVEYFRRLVESGADPQRILAITFTEKAAGNMRGKLGEALQGNPVLRARLERAWVSTVHGFCARLLRENAVSAGIDPEFTVAGEREAWRVQQESLARVLDDLYAADPEAVRSLARGIAGAGLEEAVLNAYDAMRGAGARVSGLPLFAPPAGVAMEQVVRAIHELRRQKPAGWSADQRASLDSTLQTCEPILEAAREEDPLARLRAAAGFSCHLNKLKRGNPTYDLVRRLRDLLHEVEYTLIQQHYARERELLFDIFARFDCLYRERKRQAGTLDFADLEEFAVRLLESDPETCARLRAQFDHILMDEFQDTNGQQARLLELVRSEDNFYAVGDINQSIFGFRHAEPEVFRAYRDAVAANGRHVVELADNFRSRAHILRAVETVFHQAGGVEPRPLVAGRTFAREKPVAVEVICATAADAAEALAREARWVARRILELVGDPAHPAAFRDVAVLVRNTEVLADFTRAFEEAGIPHVVNRGRGFYDTREIKDLTHLLRVLASPRDEISLAAVLRSPLVEASDEALLALRGLGTNLGSALARLAPEHAATFPPDDWRRLTRFRDLLHGWRIRRDYFPFDRLLLSAIDESGYAWEPGSRAAANIEKFLAQARDAWPRLSLDQFIEELELVRAENPREADAPPEDAADTVKVMTVHSAKGLEFPIVFVAAMHKGVESNLAVVEFSRHLGLGARWVNPATGDSKDDLFQHAIRAERKIRESEESNRLLYVAMTRAEDHLALTCSLSGRKPENWAGWLADRLGLDLATPRDELIDSVAPDGQPWTLRVFSTGEAPPPMPSPFAGVEEARPVEQAERPELEGQHDGNATVTDVAEFAACPRRYYLGRYLGFAGREPKSAPAEAGALPAAELGAQVHAILAGTPPASPDSEALDLAAVFHRSPLGRRASRASRVEREFAFLMAVGDLVLRGQIDLFFEEGGELVLVDYKTDAVSAREAHERADDYAMQLRLYALALDRLTGRAPRRAFLHFLRPDTVVEVDVTPSLLDSPEQVVADLLDAQQRLDFPLREGPHCHRCPFHRDLCPAQ